MLEAATGCSRNGEVGRDRGLPPRRVVLLGASNLSRGLSTVLETAARLWGRPLDVLAASGHGRSYGLCMGILGHRQPGIAASGLWDALDRRPPAPTAALVTDVGNDLLYDASVPQIAGWVEACLDRLHRAGARVVLTRLPLHSLATMTPRHYLVLRTLIFPGCGISLATLTERAHALDERLADLARQRGVALVRHRPDWYGIDPVHIRRRHWAGAWREMLAPWVDGGPLPEPATGSLRRWLYLRLLPPERRWLLGFERRRAQPAGSLADGTSLAFY